MRPKTREQLCQFFQLELPNDFRPFCRKLLCKQKDAQTSTSKGLRRVKLRDESDEAFLLPENISFNTFFCLNNSY